jgi:ketosteroid isomerase-like protein
MTPLETVRAFFDHVNQHDENQIAQLMSEDHLFIDSLGRSMLGREAMRAGWRAYFAMCPDYRVSQEDTFDDGNIVAAFGSAGGTISVNGTVSAENKWQTPAAWRVVVENGLIKEFRVYADNKPVYDILVRSTKPADA